MAACGGTKVDLSAVKLGEGTKEVVSPKETGETSPVVTEPPQGTPVLAPLNGTFYRSSGPGKPELAADGASVKAGDAVCIVEAMKLFNPIKATASGKITFVAKHGAAVTKGETIAWIS